MNQSYTVTDVLTLVINRLSNINVPGALIKSVGVPISESIENLKLCVEALGLTKEKKEPEQAPAEE